jgi:hypothetical protein
MHARINRGLGSSNTLYPSLLRYSAPLALQHPADPSRIITGPAGVRTATVSYFSQLYHLSPFPQALAVHPLCASYTGTRQFLPFRLTAALDRLAG